MARKMESLLVENNGTVLDGDMTHLRGFVATKYDQIASRSPIGGQYSSGALRPMVSHGM